MSDLDARLRLNAVNGDARRLGYRIAVDLLSRTPERFRVSAHRIKDEPSVARFLCNSESSAVDAAEAGLEILRDVVEGGKPWPDES